MVKSERRDDLAEHLRLEGVDTPIHYPVPPHRQAAYEAERWALPVTEQWAGQLLSLPIGPHLSDQQVEQVVAVVVAFQARPAKNPASLRERTARRAENADITAHGHPIPPEEDRLRAATEKGKAAAGPAMAMPLGLVVENRNKPSGTVPTSQ